ncbi:unnamed protein product [Bursaphelenchus xylophilus]|uniref:Poly [ADP-ribose] polymerase n=1 Tax=Bursaphelenchus xylophilus TaxID=6326 RepID=A0A1I7SLQ7_BURXY|nr:unnamed protein product [Bursaphelenchus xylophilus]CAG9129704.1 unnamed protein product [Bursaphelenchus xylophilus]
MVNLRSQAKKKVAEANKENEDVVAKKAKLEKFVSEKVKTKVPKVIKPDPECPVLGFKVYQKNGRIYDALLNQTNISMNNNKFYLLQVLESEKGPKTYKLWYRWGRVGYKGQTNLREMSLQGAKKEFEEKFHAKTNNVFGEKFQKFQGKYDLIPVDYSRQDEEERRDDLEDESVPCTLDPRVKNVIDLISDLKAMEKHLKRLHFDTNRTPLGCILKDQIKVGYKILSKIEKRIIGKSFGGEFHALVSDYYTKIPHYFGMRPPSSLQSLEDIKDELSLLEALVQAEAIVDHTKKEIKKINPSDRNYQRLNCKLEPISNKHKTFKMIEKYLKNTHGPTHKDYKMKVKNVFELEKEGTFNTGIDNHQLLWHGSRLLNWFGILLKGLQIAPPEAPITGHMFGKGIYFADCASKSANYCDAKHGDIGFLLLSQVALGAPQELTKAKYEASNLPEGVHSTKGIGQMEPDQKKSEYITLDGTKVKIPLGKIVEKEKTDEFELLYNEYVVYSREQVKLRYLVEIEFEVNQ